jgi:hypothetical protein
MTICRSVYEHKYVYLCSYTLRQVARDANETPYERSERRRLAKKRAELDAKLKKAGVLGVWNEPVLV